MLPFLKRKKTRDTGDLIIEALLTAYYEEERMARQLLEHAEKAPYPFFGKELRRLAGEEERQATLLKDKISSLGGVVPSKETAAKGGWNHWDRLVADLKDEQVQRAHYEDQAIRSGSNFGSLRGMWLELADEESRHIGVLRELILRSDPHAGR